MSSEASWIRLLLSLWSQQSLSNKTTRIDVKVFILLLNYINRQCTISSTHTPILEWQAEDLIEHYSDDNKTTQVLCLLKGQRLAVTCAILNRQWLYINIAGQIKKISELKVLSSQPLIEGRKNLVRTYVEVMTDVQILCWVTKKGFVRWLPIPSTSRDHEPIDACPNELFCHLKRLNTKPNVKKFSVKLAIYAHSPSIFNIEWWIEGLLLNFRSIERHKSDLKKVV